MIHQPFVPLDIGKIYFQTDFCFLVTPFRRSRRFTTEKKKKLKAKASIQKSKPLKQLKPHKNPFCNFESAKLMSLKMYFNGIVVQYHNKFELRNQIDTSLFIPRVGKAIFIKRKNIFPIRSNVENDKLHLALTRRYSLCMKNH